MPTTFVRLGNSQAELHLLCSCLSLCRINHLIRTVASDVIEVNYPDLTLVCGHRSSPSFIPQYQTSPGNRPPCQYDWVVWAFANQQEQHRQLSLQAVTRYMSWFFNYCLECNSLPSSPAHLLTNVSALNADQS